jgi:hypothetical protein
VRANLSQMNVKMAMTVCWRLSDGVDMQVPAKGAKQPLVGQGLVIIKASRPHSDTPHSVGLIWTSDQPDAQKGGHKEIYKSSFMFNYVRRNEYVWGSGGMAPYISLRTVLSCYWGALPAV